MGIFSSRKKTYVSSVVYNLAGEIQDRPDYLKSVVLGNMITQRQFSIVDTLQSSYLSGPGMRLRAFHRWAKINYPQIGIPTDRFYSKDEINPEAVAAEMLATYDITAFIDWVDAGAADIVMWGRQWLRDNLPAKEALDVWTVDFIEETGEALINFTDGTPPAVFTPTGYDPASRWYLYVSYSRPQQINRWSTPKLFIYKRGSGSVVLDALVIGNTVAGEYIPFIPIRHENEFISETYKPNVYIEAKKAYKKAIGNKFDELIDKVEDNPDLDEIDFAYIVFGASLNTKDMSSRRYIFRYLKHLIESQLLSNSAFGSWADSQGDNAYNRATWENWNIDQQDISIGSPVTSPAPARPGYSTAPNNTVIIEDRGVGQSNLKMEMKWNSMGIVTGSGLGKADAEVNEVWFAFTGSETIVASAYTADEVENLDIDTIEIYWQKSATEYEKITAVGFTHLNHIYNGKYVEISAAQALLDDDESGFLVPIHYGILREISIIDSTQMSTQCVNIVFNSYQIVKKKWYQKGIFRVLLVIVIIVVIALTGGFAAGTVGFLGTNLGVGLALGFSGLAAVIAGVVANMVAAMILTQLITAASIEILGEEIGLIIAAIASFIALSVGTALRAGESLATAWSSIMNAQNLLQLTNSVGNAYTQILQGDTLAIMARGQEALNDFRKQSLELQENYADQFGYGTALFDPMRLTEASESFFTESSETFLGRTLLTGSDIANMTNELITNFVELSLRNEFNKG